MTGLYVDSGIIHGSSFTTDNESYTLNSVTASFTDFADFGEDNLSIRLYTNNGSQPGTVIESLSTTANIAPDSYNNYLFTPNNTVNLAANTTYWLMGYAASGAYGWGATDSFNQTGDWTIGNGRAFSFDGGSPWESFNDFPAQFSIDADVASAAVPFEFSPAMGILLMGGLFGGKAAYGKYQVSKIKI